MTCEGKLDLRLIDAFNLQLDAQIQFAPELIANEHGSFDGFPAPSGPIRELDSIDGVEFDGIGAQTTLQAFNTGTSGNR